MSILSSNTWTQKTRREFIKDNYSSTLEIILRASFDPFINTGLKNLKVLEETPYIIDNPLEKFKNLIFSPNPSIDILRESAFELVNCNDYTIESKRILARILTKTLDIGIDNESINKALNKNIITCPVLMSSVDINNNVSDWNGIMYEIYQKGIRVIAYVSGNNIKFFTSNFNEIPLEFLKNISKECLRLIKTSSLKGDWFFDGKLLLDEIPKEPQENAIYKVFDLEEADTLKIGRGIIPFEIRKETLKGIFTSIKTDYVDLIESFLASNKEEVYAQRNDAINRGYKGIIMKNPDHVYECKKSNNWIEI